jgi:hypothetical protein
VDLLTTFCISEVVVEPEKLTMAEDVPREPAENDVAEIMKTIIKRKGVTRWKLNIQTSSTRVKYLVPDNAIEIASTSFFRSQTKERIYRFIYHINDCPFINFPKRERMTAKEFAEPDADGSCL